MSSRKQDKAVATKIPGGGIAEGLVKGFFRAIVGAKEPAREAKEPVREAKAPPPAACESAPYESASSKIHATGEARAEKKFRTQAAREARRRKSATQIHEAKIREGAGQGSVRIQQVFVQKAADEVREIFQQICRQGRSETAHRQAARCPFQVGAEAGTGAGERREASDAEGNR